MALGNGLGILVGNVLAWAILVALVAAGAWDLWCVQVGRPAATVSRVIWAWQERLPVLVLLLGILLGHLFFPLIIETPGASEPVPNGMERVRPGK